LVAGFCLRECASLQEAIEWAKRCFHPMPGEEATVEIRQLFELDDFGPKTKSELREEVAEKVGAEKHLPAEKR
jgi:hypothetical protein